MDRRGFTLIELMIGLVLAGIVALAIYQTLLNNQRVYTMQTERAAMNSNTRTAVALLPMELRELDANDPIDSNIISADSDFVEYKAMRSLFFVCQPPVDGGSTGSLILWSNPSYGLRPSLNADLDSVVIFAEGATGSRADNAWIHANVSTVVTGGSLCPSTGSSIAVALTNVTPSGGLSRVRDGAPVRGFEVVKVGTYTSGGNRWLGAQRFDKSSNAYSAIQPILGPLDADGLLLTYFDQFGAATSVDSAIARIGLRVIGQTERDVYITGDLRRVVDTLLTSVALRNRRP